MDLGRGHRIWRWPCWLDEPVEELRQRQCAVKCLLQPSKQEMMGVVLTLMQAEP